MIRCQNLSYRYPNSSSRAISEVTLDLGPGELTLVSGPSGSGKSTLLRALNGLIPHFHGGTLSGTVTVEGISTVQSRPRDLAERIGFVGQDPESSSVVDRVEEDIAFVLENLGIRHDVMRKRVEEVLDAVGIAALRSRRIDSLSGGERQRVAIAGALAAMPKYLVLDEPTSQLDPQSAEEVLSCILRLRDEIGIAAIVSEQRLERVIQYADRMVCPIETGVIDGAPADVMEQVGWGPPIVMLGRSLGWSPLALSLRQARHRLGSTDHVVPEQRLGPSPGEPALLLRGVSVEVSSGREVLRDIETTFHLGEVTALMGRNGSGKTTLLRAAAKLVASKGSVTMHGTIGLLPQDPQNILFRQSLADEIRATLRGRKLPHAPADITREAEELGVSGLLDRYPHDLSGGEKTKAAIAAVAAGGPDILLLDEPTRGLDQPSKEHLRSLLERWRSMGRCVVIATHDVELAATVADRVCLMAEGEIVVDGPARQVLAGSLTFSTQMSKVFQDDRISTLDDALRATAR